MIITETSERNDSKNWVKDNLLNDGFNIISFEGYTIKGGLTTALFDRRQFQEEDIGGFNEDEIEELIRYEEPYLNAKLSFAERIKVNYYYVFYNYDSQRIILYRFGGEVFFTLPPNNKLDAPLQHIPRYFKRKIFKYNSFCEFINLTKHIRDLKMLSGFQGKGLPMIDQIFRGECKYPWMGNLDGLFLTNESNEPKAIIEWQTTIAKSVKNHCNNDWFAPSANNKGDEQRWRVVHDISKQWKLPLIIIVWSHNEKNGDIKYKVVSDVIYSDSINSKNPKAGLVYKEKSLITYSELCQKLNDLSNS